MKSLLPEGKGVYLRDLGITTLPLYGLNRVLAAQGYVIQTRKVRDARRFVTCIEKDGQVERYGLFALRPIPPEAPGRTNRERRKRR